MPRETVWTTRNDVATRKNSHLEQAYSSVPKVNKTDWRKSLNSSKASPATKAKNPLSLVGKMKKIVAWLSTSSRVSWLQVWNQMHSWLSLPITTCWMVRGKTSARSKRRKYSRISCYSEGKKVQGCVSQKSDPWIIFFGKLKNWDWTLRRDTPWNSQDAPGTRLNSGKKKAIWRHYPKKWNSWAKSLRAQFWEETPEETSRQAYCTSKVAWNLARKYASSKPKTFTFHSPAKVPETQKIVRLCCGFESFNAQCWARRIQLRNNGYFEKVQKHHERLTATGSSANKRVSTSFCSWSRSDSQQCNYSMKRQRIYCFISFAQNADIHVSGKRRNSTMDQKWEDNYLHSGQLSSSPCIKTVIMISLIVPENWDHDQIR